jgi:transglutaminase-like putative cysteine protease
MSDPLNRLQGLSQGQSQGQSQGLVQGLQPAPPAPAVRLRLPPSGPRLLRVTHETRYDYDAPVEVAHHSAWLRPRDTELQKVQRWDLQIEPLPDTAVQESEDAFHNWRHGFSHSRVHDRLMVTSRFQVLLSAPPDLDSSLSPPWEEVARSLRYRAGVTQPDAVEFVLPSHFAPHATELAAFAQDLFTPGRPLLEAAQALMTRVFVRMLYKPHSTDVATNALQALAQGQGVCQDFAHLMIGALRSLGLAARYVSGYLLTQPPEGQPRLVGADASHAWVAVWCPLHGWVALDPTNNVQVGQDHVTLAWGRDYADVAPLRGVIRGGGTAPPVVGVTVEPV